MSEYQYVHFLAVDRPLDDEQLKFMERQSTRAEISRWEFANSYHFGDFRGNPIEMLRRGYDLHLHYANFGIRRIMVRLPGGLPCSKAAFKAYRVTHCVEWHADKSGPGGILAIEPEGDAGTFDEDLFDADEYLPRIAPIREMLAGGDLRPLYVAWLACAWEESREPPVPAGLKVFPGALAAMAEFYEVRQDLLAAAAELSPPAPGQTNVDTALGSWIADQSPEKLRALVYRFLTGDAGACRAETLARVRTATGASDWPSAPGTRTLGELRELAEGVKQRRLAKENQTREAAQRKRLAAMAADPSKAIAEVEKLVSERSTDSYQKAAKTLAALREALGPKAGPTKAKGVASRLRQMYPTRKHLIAALQREGLLD